MVAATSRMRRHLPFVVLGLALAALAAWQEPAGRWRKAAVALLLMVVELAHLLPALLWMLFHGRGISDGTPPAAFVAHWAYALPHLAVAFLDNVALQRLLRGR